MNTHTVGFKTLALTIATGANIHAKLNDIAKHEGQDSALYAGAVSCLLTAFAALRQAGITFDNENPEIDRFLKSNNMSGPLAWISTFRKWKKVRSSAA